MDRKRRDYVHGYGGQHPEPVEYPVGYYDNPHYFPGSFWDGRGVRYPSRFGAPLVKEHPVGVFPPSSGSSESTDSHERRKMSNRKYILTAVIAVAVLVIAAIVTAIVVATALSDSAESKGPATYQKTVRKGVEGKVTMASKTWYDALNDKNSPEYISEATEFQNKMDEKLRDVENYKETIVTDIQEGSLVFLYLMLFELEITVTIEDDTATTTTAAPGDDYDDLFTPDNSNVFIDFDINILFVIIDEDPEFTDVVVSEVNECDPNPCNNGGNCTNGVGDFTCTCLPGYTGTFCDAGIDECESEPCQNDGVCTDQLNAYTCTCVSGFQGINCETNIDDCNANPCQNGGRCEDGINQYTCECEDGFEGDNCQIDINDCDPTPCKNAVSCTDGVDDYTCTCNAGWDGKDCDNDIDDCNANPCQNGGRCEDGINQYTCECEDGFEGDNCQIDIDDCDPTPCVNAVSCTDGVDVYTCTCNAGWDGKDCDNDIDDCETDPCENEGTCVDGIDEYTCFCEAGWEGKDCNIDIDDCDPNPCVNADSCTDTVDDYTCTCNAGWDGKNCDNNIDDCETDPCENEGTCIDGIDEYTCICEAGWEGKDCNINIDDCESAPCWNEGTCADGINEYTCTCEAGWEGQTCNINIDECKNNPCTNGGQCIDGLDDYTCICEAGWEGKNCDNNLDDCIDDPCGEQGECVDGNNEYTCTCLAGWSGKHCESNIDDCATNPCQNAGVCEDAINSYTCVCADGFNGYNCEINIDECEDVSCENGGRCEDGINDYTCNCEAGWEGKDCETDINDCENNPCQFGGTCTDMVNGYVCSCQEGLTGKDCDENIDDCVDDPCEHGSCEDEVNSFNCTCDSGWEGDLCNLDIDECSADADICKNSAACQNTVGSFTCICTPGWAGNICDTNINECLLDDGLCGNGGTCIDTEGSYQCNCTDGWEGENCEIEIMTTTTRTSSSASTEAETEEPTSVEPSPNTTTQSTQSTWSTTMNTSTCEPDEMQCHSGECFPIHWECDGYSDCSDGSDERYCSNTTTSLPRTSTPTTIPTSHCTGCAGCSGSTLVANNAVITKFRDKRMDGQKSGVPKACRSNQHYCDGTCIPYTYVCDGVPYCYDESDEEGCLHCPEERCGNGVCYNSSMICDGHNDCSDGTDEMECPFVLNYRLMNWDNETTDQLFGRVEVMKKVNGIPASVYGTICDDSWDYREAMVLCRALGADEGQPSFAYRGAMFGQGTGPVWLSNFHCEGNEEKLEDCISSAFGGAHCSNTRDAAISCGIDRRVTLPTTSFSTTSDLPTTTTSAPEIGVRLVGGEDCLEGRVEILYGGRWGSICDDYLFTYEALAICRTLGYSGFETYGTFDYAGTGDIFGLNCNFFDYTVWDCVFETDPYCFHYEDSGIRCSGDPGIECGVIIGFPNVTCSFNEDVCAYNLSVVSGGNNWTWTQASSKGMTDSENVENGKIMVFENEFGSENDAAWLKAPPFIPTAENMTVEFFYQLHDSSFKNLKVGLKEIRPGPNVDDITAGWTEHEIWSSEFLLRDREYRWLYQCVSLRSLNQSSNYSLMFTAVRGPHMYSAVALDNVAVNEGECAESLLDGACDFDRTSSCGLTVECPTICNRAAWDYTWMWQNGTKYNDLSLDGYFMLANSSFGLKGDEAIMRFAVPSFADKTLLYFLYYMYGDNGGTLEVQLFEGDSLHSSLITLSGEQARNAWSGKCLTLPSNVDTSAGLDIIFKAVHGQNMEAIIGVDSVSLETGECPNPIGCNEQLPQCGWFIDANKNLSWTFHKDNSAGASNDDIIRLVDGPTPNNGTVEVYYDGVWGRVCDDLFGTAEAQVICGMLGYQTDDTDYLTNSPFGGPNVQIWLDNLDCDGTEESLADCPHNGWGVENCGSSEYAGVVCYGEIADTSFDGTNIFKLDDRNSNAGEWASLSSVEFYLNTTEDYKFMFEVTKSSEGIFQVWYKDHATEQTHMIDKLIGPAYGEFHCSNLPPRNTGNELITIGITAFKISSSSGSIGATLQEFSLKEGLCEESFDKRMYTFETDHRLYAYNVLPTATNEGCKPEKGWTRLSASSNQGMDIDHTFMNGSGHFMFARGPPNHSELQLGTVTEEDAQPFCSLQFYYFTIDETRDTSLHVIVNGVREKMAGIPKVTAWFAGCVPLVDTCGDTPGALDITFEVTNLEAGVDDVQLSVEPCPEPKDDSVSCEFVNGNLCGYYIDNSTWLYSPDGNLTSWDVSGSYLVSPAFNVTTGSCATARYEGSSSQLQLILIDGDGEIMATTGFHNAEGVLGREIHLDVPPGTDWRLFLESVELENNFYKNNLIVHYIDVEDKSCEDIANGTQCSEESDLRCGDICVPEKLQCDGERQCVDGSDERLCPCDIMTFNCTQNDECIHPSLFCDGTNDCTDESDETSCAHSVTCSFVNGFRWTCGYELHNAVKTNGLEMGPGLAYIESPPVSVETGSCLGIFGYNYGVNIRISSTDGEKYSILYQGSVYDYSLSLLVDVAEGEYGGFVLETLSSSYHSSSMTFMSVELFGTPCTDVELQTTTAATTNWQSPTDTETQLPDMTTGWPQYSSTPTPDPLPDDFPELIAEDPAEVDIGGSSNLTCTVRHNENYELIMYWIFDENQIITREDDIMEPELKDKFDVRKSRETGQTIYMLTVHDVTEYDASASFDCMADVVGFHPRAWPRKGTYIKFIEDNCTAFHSIIDDQTLCPGYKRITTPTVSGVQSMQEMKGLGIMFRAIFSYAQDYSDDQCFNPMHKLACGLQFSHCQAGQVVRQVCREHCQEIAGFCMNFPPDIVSNNNTDLGHYCKYLPSIDEQVDCQGIWLECGADMTVGAKATPSYIHLRSENFPQGSPSESQCSYSFATMPYYVLNVTLLGIHLEEDCMINYLMVNGEKLCSNNASLVEDMGDDGLLEFTLYVENPDIISGFLLSISQELPTSVCDIVEISKDTYEEYDSALTKSETCSEWWFYRNTRDYNMVLKSVEGCVQLQGADYDQEICDTETEPDLNGLDMVRIISPEDDFRVTYFSRDEPNQSSYTIQIIELKHGDTESSGRVYITREDGGSGFMCGYFTEDSANVICEGAGLGMAQSWNDDFMQNERDNFLLYGLQCNGDEDSIVQCPRQEWVDDCNGDCSCYSNSTGISCGKKSVSCILNSTDVCGYDYDSSVTIQVYTIRFGDGLYMNGLEAGATRVTSPNFSYLQGDRVYFEYSFDGQYGDNLELLIQRSDELSEASSIWDTGDQVLNGRLAACVYLPADLTDTDVRLIFKMSISDTNHTVGLHLVTVNSEGCQDPFPENACSFDNVDVCDVFFSQTCLSGNVWQIRDGILIGDSTHAMQDMEYTVTFTMYSSVGSHMRLKYYQTGTGVDGNDLEFKIRFVSETDGSDTIYMNSVFGQEFEKICLSVTSTGDATLNASFILTKHNSEGKMFLDDILINNEPCPHQISCDFENSKICEYWVTDGDLLWERILVDKDKTSGGNYGYVMQVLHLDTSIDGVTGAAVFKTPVANIGEDTHNHCLSFFYKYSYENDIAYRLFVEVNYLDVNQTVTHDVGLVLPYMWQEENIEVYSNAGYRVQFSFFVTNLYGYSTYPLVIDDVSLLPEKCIEGLQDLIQCDFSQPGLCRFEVNCTAGSGFIWTLNGGTSRNGSRTGPAVDGDGSPQGTYLYLDSSMGDSGHESLVWFNVDLTDTTSKTYKFAYQLVGESASRLETFYRNSDTNTYSERIIVGGTMNAWFGSYCYPLPDGFKGEIYIYGALDESVHGDIAIDNVRILDECEDPSMSCEFLDSMCGYQGWTLSDGSASTSQSSSLHAPVFALQEDSCITFEFESGVNNNLMVLINTESGQIENSYTVYTEGTTMGHIEYMTDYTGMTFFVPGEYFLKINHVTAVPGECSPMECDAAEITCEYQCIPDNTACDRNWDCNDGRDEDNCGFSMACEFTDFNDCGYTTASESATEWEVLDSHLFEFNNTQYSVSDWILLTSFEDDVVSSTNSFTSQWTAVSSTWQAINTTKCLRFKYLGTVPWIGVSVDYRDRRSSIGWNDPYMDMTPAVWRHSQMTLKPGAATVTFNASMHTANYTVSPPDDAFVAISDIQLLQGGCDTIHPPDCPAEASFQCDDGSLCYNEEVLCDRKQYCQSGADEIEDICGSELTIACDFEDPAICGWQYGLYTNWRLSTGYRYQIPAYDHTKGDETGHFLLAVNWNNDHDTYEEWVVTSPIQTFTEDGCFTFWYFLNSTAVQPNGLSAQILVSIIYPDTKITRFVWYDYVDRRIDGWIQGGARVPANTSVQVEVKSRQFEMYTSWPGVVALDDPDFSPGKCEVFQECHRRSFECVASRVCIPIEFVCDGKDDCEDSSDEADCYSRPDGSVVLAGGDSYGQLRFYKEGSWRAVCTTDDDEESQYMSEWVCGKLGFNMFTGTATSYVYELREANTLIISLSCDNPQSCTDYWCNGSYSNQFVGIKCSDSECFAGTRLCPGSSPVEPDCVPEDRFCDGLPDCLNGTDEMECYCKEGENKCTKTRDECTDATCKTCKERDMFECQNHQCLDKAKRCDFNTDCTDGSDEYRCVYVDDHQVVLNNGSDLSQICYNNVGLSEAEWLCSLSGKGVVRSNGILHGYEKIDGGVVITGSNSEDGFLQGLQISYAESCYPLILECELPECGTTAYLDRPISPFITFGDLAVPGEWPSLGVLRRSGSFHCGCSWLGGRFVLTAAHCVEDHYWNLGSYTVMFGSTISDDKGLYGQEYDVLAANIHPGYDEYDITRGNDVAVLTLSFTPNLDNYTRPVCLGTVKSLQITVDMGDEADCYIQGYGADERFHGQGINPEKELRETKVAIIDWPKCDEVYTTTLGYDNIVSHDGLCLENGEPYQAACYGDSGGPFVCKNKQGRWEQFGISSYGATDCNKNVPNVYVNVTAHLDFIESITNMNFEFNFGDTP